MKKTISTLFAALVASAGLLFAQTATEVDKIYYNFNETDLTAKVTYAGWSPSEIKEYSGDVVILPTVNYNGKTYDVIGVYDHAFDGCDGLTSVTFPNSVKSLGWSAFENCTRLKVLNFADGLEKIGAECFKGCTGLRKISFGTGFKEAAFESFAGCINVQMIICKAAEPPILQLAIKPATDEYTRVFEGVDCSQIPVFAPALSLPKYYRDSEWNRFKFIKAYDAQTIVIDALTLEPSPNSVEISWPANDQAVSYFIEVREANTGERICHMTFNAEGQILTAGYSAPARNGERKLLAAEQTSNGWKYTIDGLKADTEYDFYISATKSDDTDVYTVSDKFKTPEQPTAIETLESPDSDNSGSNNSDAVRACKFFRNGQLFITRGGETYNVHGAKIE